MDYNKRKQLILKAMRKIYYENINPRYDWMGYMITDDNKPTYHHIVKREELIEQDLDPSPTIENGAYLGKCSHEMLHVIEQIDPELYMCWNDLFLMINNFGVFPVNHIWELVFKLKRQTEEEITAYKQSKNRIK